jgi:hypothetical protein
VILGTMGRLVFIGGPGALLQRHGTLCLCCEPKGTQRGTREAINQRLSFCEVGQTGCRTSDCNLILGESMGVALRGAGQWDRRRAARSQSTRSVTWRLRDEP